MGLTKNLLPIIVGTMAAMILFTLLRNAVVYHVYPLPGGTDLYDADSFAKAVKLMPTNEFILLLADSAITSLIGGIIATLIVGRTLRLPAIATGVILTFAGIILSLSLHYPSWVLAVGLFMYLPFTYLGYLIVRKR